MPTLAHPASQADPGARGGRAAGPAGGEGAWSQLQEGGRGGKGGASAVCVSFQDGKANATDGNPGFLTGR